MHFFNAAVRRDAGFRGLFDADDYARVRAFFDSHPELAPTPLRSLPSLARETGLGELLVKDETARFGVNAFKIAGVRYAVHRIGAEAARLGLVCATAGNHGRAVARVARDIGVPCSVFVPALKTSSPLEVRTREARVAAMRADGADVIQVDGTYEEAVQRAADHGATTGATIVSDTSWPGYEEIPRWIMAGYTHVFDEASAQWREPPSLVVVQGGVGGLVCAAASWFAWRFGAARPLIVACEPENAACLLASAQAGRPVHIDSSLETIMAGLRCAEPSAAAWPAIASGVDAFVTVTDAEVERTLASLANGPIEERILAGPSGACSVAAVVELMRSKAAAELRRAIGLDAGTRALAVVTEGQ